MSLSHLGELKRFLQSLGIHPKKSLSQNFLINEAIIQQLLDAANISTDDHILEIGPGPGGVTEQILNKTQNLTTVELDHVFAMSLKQRFESVKTFEANALEFDYTHLHTPTKVISSLPYSVAADIIKKLIRLHPQITTITVIIQKEMADTICAEPNSKIYGPLTLECQLFADAKYLFTIPANCFYPEPKIKSAAIQLTTKPPAYDEKILPFIYEAFRHRRKMVRKFFGLVEGIPQNARAENLTLEQFAKAWLSKYNHENKP
ncbi:MAG: ribosomal RNA small subunit methyltransferase A [Chlamydiales bacterium]|nr:ribosomal RNA small subunit methyltransferase A [Chlamydiales bacterium]